MRRLKLEYVGLCAVGLALFAPVAVMAQTAPPPSATTPLPTPAPQPSDPEETGTTSVGESGPSSFLNAPSPEKIAITPGGVDIRTGRLGYSKTDLSIGDGGGSISLQRITATTIPGHANPFGNLSHNWDITLFIKPVSLDQYPGNNDYVANVSFGGRSQTFEKLYLSDAVFRQKSQNDFTRLTTPGTIGALGVTYSYRATDGTVAQFRPIAAGECTADPTPYQCAYVANVVEPDGTRYDFEYETTTAAVTNKTRLRAVASSRGYVLLLEYGAGGASWNQVSKACVINLGLTAKPANNICPAGALATASYTYSADSLGLAVASVTAPDNATEGFTYTDIVGGVSHKMAQTKPGQGTPWAIHTMENTLTQDGIAETYVKSQAFADGSSFAYFYDFTPSTTDGSGSANSYDTISGGGYTNALGQTTEVRYDFPVTPSSFSPPRVPSAAAYPYVLQGDIVYQVTPGPARIVDPFNRTTTNDFCDPGAASQGCLVSRQQSSTDPEGNVVKLKYGINNNPIEIRRVAKPGSSPSLADIVESATYDSNACLNFLKTCDKPVTVTDAKGIVTDYTWDINSGNMLTETRAAPVAGAVRPQKRYSYVQTYAWYKNAAGTVVQSPYPVWLPYQTSECRSGAAPACVGTADETRTTYSYGPGGAANNLLPVSVTVAAGDGSVTSSTSFTYDALGNKLTEDGPLTGTADTTRWRYDTARRVVGVIKPDPDGIGTMKFRATRNTYDPAGRLVKVEVGTVDSQSDAHWAVFAPIQTVETAYDQLDRKTREWTYGTTGGTQQLTQYSYDLAGRLECSAVRMNPAIYTGLPPSACTLGTAGDDGPDRITKLTYDAAGQLLKTTVAYGVTGEQTDQETNTYTLNGKLVTVTDGENNRTTFEYDGHDRLFKTRYPVPALGALTSSITDYEQLTYDENGNVTQHRKRDDKRVYFTYDALNRMTYKDVLDTGPNAVVGEYDVTTTYDSFDRPLVVTDTSGNSVGASYDALGRMISQSSPTGSFALAYDEAGRLKRISHPDGNYFTYGYNTADLTNIKENGTTTLVTYGYDNLGRRTSLTRGNGTASTYAFDAVGRVNCLTQNLTSGGSPACTPTPSATGADQATTFGYIPSGQIKSLTRANDSYAWTAHYNVNRSYDTNGLNQLTTAGATALGYDGRGNLTSSDSNTYTYTSENRLATGPAGVTLYYDPTGRLSRLIQGTSNTKFEYIGPRLVIERNAAGTILKRYVHGPGDDEPVVLYEGATLATKRWLHTDERGSVIAISDASGASIATNRYDEYGIPQSTNSGRFQFTGQAWVPELGLYYYKARFYSPTLGRFMQTDPIGYKDGINWYDYVRGDPVNNSDTTGNALDTIADIGFLLYDGYKIATEGATPTNVAAAGADVVGLFVPLATGGGVAVRTGGKLQAGKSATKAAKEKAKGAGIGPGPYAKGSIPAGPTKSPNAAQQRKINNLGKSDGCHTCGTKDPGTQAGDFVGDHQPPNAINPAGGQQDYFPQCLHCSRVQGGKTRQLTSTSLPPPPPTPKNWWSKIWTW